MTLYLGVTSTELVPNQTRGAAVAFRCRCCVAALLCSALLCVALLCFALRCITLSRVAPLRRVGAYYSARDSARGWDHRTV